MATTMTTVAVMVGLLLAARRGFVVSPKAMDRPAPEVTREEEFVRQINRISEEFSPEFWRRYRELRVKLDAELLIPDGPEHQELMRMTDQLELRHADRLGLLIELARLRKTSLAEVMKHSDVLAHFHG